MARHSLPLATDLKEHFVLRHSTKPIPSRPFDLQCPCVILEKHGTVFPAASLVQSKVSENSSSRLGLRSRQEALGASAGTRVP